MLEGFPDRTAGAVTAPEKLEELGHRVVLLPGSQAVRAVNARAPRPLWRAFVIDWNHLRSRGGG